MFSFYISKLSELFNDLNFMFRNENKEIYCQFVEDREFNKFMMNTQLNKENSIYILI